MVLGFSWGEVALILGASAALFGPKDIVIIGRAAGRLTGKAVGYIQSARGHIAPIMQRSEINTVHKELRETMAQLEAIRHEMRSGISIMNPGGPLTSRGLLDVVPPLSNPPQSSHNGTKETLTLNQRKPVSHASSGVSSPVSPTQALQDGAGASRVGGHPVGLASALPVSQESKHSNGAVKKPSDQELVVLPISAVEAGLLPSNQEPISDGADLVFASIMERKVAFQSKKFLEGDETQLVVHRQNILDVHKTKTPDEMQAVVQRRDILDVHKTKAAGY